MNVIKYIPKIIEQLKAIDPYKVILFGSHAYGNPQEDSDLDILVITNDEFYPKNYDENMENYLRVALLISDIRKKISIDLIVHTKMMHNKFIELGSSFSKEILKHGKILYERYN